MAGYCSDEEIHRLLDALGFDETICYMKQSLVQAHESVKNVFVGPKASVIHTGSSAEGFSGEYYSKLSQSDFDIMISFNFLLYIANEDQLRSDVKTDIPFVARVSHDKVPPGYAKLEPIIDEEVALTSSLVVRVDNRLFVSSSSALSTLMPSHRLLVGKIGREEEEKVQFVRHGPASSVVVQSEEEGFAKRDVVCGFCCQFWPKCAQKWVTRDREWPAREVVVTAAKKGCHLVPTGFPGSKTEHLEWRYSFAKAEREIMWLFNDCQRKCYALLKILNKEIVAIQFDTEILTSYHVKTAMLWVLEEIPSSEWEGKNLFDGVRICMAKLMTFVRSRLCPHYFIDDANLFGRDIFTEDICNQLINILDSILDDTPSALSRCPTFQNFAHDITSIDVDFLHRCHVGFQWFKMCSIQLDELVSMSGGRYLRDMMDHYKVNKTMAFNVRVHDELNGTNSNSIQELFARPFVLLNHVFLGILHHIEVTKMVAVDDEDFEIRNLYIEDARKNFVKGATGNDVTSKLRMACFELVMKNYELADKILRDISCENTCNIYRRDKEIGSTMAKFEKIIFKFISELITKKSKVRVNAKKMEDFIERAYHKAQVVLKCHTKTINPSNDLGGNFLDFLSKRSWLTDIVLLPEEIDCVPFPFQLQLASLRDAQPKFVSYHLKIFALALRSIAYMARGDLEAAKLFVEEMSSALRHIRQEYQSLTLNLIGNLSLKMGNVDIAWQTAVQACFVHSTDPVSAKWLVAMIISKKFQEME